MTKDLTPDIQEIELVAAPTLAADSVKKLTIQSAIPNLSVVSEMTNNETHGDISRLSKELKDVRSKSRLLVGCTVLGLMAAALTGPATLIPELAPPLWLSYIHLAGTLGWAMATSSVSAYYALYHGKAEQLRRTRDLLLSLVRRDREGLLTKEEYLAMYERILKEELKGFDNLEPNLLVQAAQAVKQVAQKND